MKISLGKICQGAEKICLSASAASLFALVAVGTEEIACRNALAGSIPWAQEFIQLCLGMSVFLAAPVLVRRRRDISIPWLRERLLPPSLHRGLNLAFDGLSMAFLAVLFVYSIRLQALQAKAISIGLGIGMNWFTLPVTVFSGISLLFFLERMESVFFPGRDRQ